MPLRIGILDISAAIMVLVVIFMPSRAVTVQPAYGDDVRVVRDVERAQARLAIDPKDGEAAYELVRGLLELGQTDWALRAAGKAADYEGPDAWRALLSVSVAHAQRIEVKEAARFATLALEACARTSAHCPSDEEVRLELYDQKLQAGVAAIEAGIDPRYEPQKFRQAMDRALRTVRIRGAPTESPSEGTGEGAGADR